MLNILISFIQIFFQLTGALLLFFAGSVSLFQYISNKPWETSRKGLSNSEQIRIALGQKIVFALEFFIIADAVTTILKPGVEELIQLVIIVGIRTALSFFISRELYTMHDFRKKEGHD